MFEGEHAKNLISAVLLYDIYSFWCCVLDNLIFVSLLHTMLIFWLISWFKLMDVFNTLVYLYKFTIFFNLYSCCFCKLLGLFSCICRLLWFVPCLCSLYALLYLLCSLVLLAFSLSTLTLVP